MTSRNRKLARKHETRRPWYHWVNLLKAVGVGIMCVCCPAVGLSLLMDWDD